MSNCIAITVIASILIPAWTLMMRTFARYSGWIQARHDYPGSYLPKGKWFPFLTLWFGTQQFSGMAGNIVVSEKGLGILSLAPLPFFGPICIPWTDVTVTRGKVMVVRMRNGSVLSITSGRAPAIIREIERVLGSLA